MKKSTERIRVAALHEAGHILVGHLLGYNIKRVTIFNLSTARKTGLDGRVVTSYNLRSTPLLYRGAVRLAGYATERICTRQDISLINDHCANDSALLQEDWGASHLSKKQELQLLKKSFFLAQKIICQNWVTLLWLYEALQIGTLTGKQITEIVERYKK
jgi:hypothetical protein